MKLKSIEIEESEATIKLTLPSTRLTITVRDDNSIEIFSPNHLKVAEQRAVNSINVLVEQRNQ